MNTTSVARSPAIAPDHCALVQGHQSFRGLSVEQNLLTPYTMYAVELDAHGLFISDSRAEAFNMAFAALFHPAADAWTPEFAS